LMSHADKPIYLFAKEPDSFKKFYEVFKQDFMKFLESYQKFKEKHGREPNEEELRALIEKWLKEEADA